MEKLKPCPFCGSEAEIKDFSDPMYNEHYYAIVCSNSLCCTNTTFGFRSETKQGVINAWNRRSNNEA